MPMQVGLIGGIGPAATDFYYRRLIGAFAREKAALERVIRMRRGWRRHRGRSRSS